MHRHVEREHQRRNQQEPADEAKQRAEHSGDAAGCHERDEIARRGMHLQC